MYWDIRKSILYRITQYSWLITGFVTRLTPRVPLVEQELLTLPEHMRSVVFCVRFCRSLFDFLSFFFCSLCCLFFFDLRILITSLWYLQALLVIVIKMYTCYMYFTEDNISLNQEYNVCIVMYILCILDKNPILQDHVYGTVLSGTPTEQDVCNAGNQKGTVLIKLTDIVPRKTSEMGNSLRR